MTDPLTDPKRNPVHSPMQAPFEWNEQGGAPDLLSQDLHRRTALIAVSALVGLGSGVFCLLFAGTHGGLVWLGFSVLAMALLFLLCRYFELGIVAFLGVCWIAIGTPTLAQGGSGGGAQQLKVSQAGLIVLLGLWGLRRFFQMKRGDVGNKLYRTPVNLPILLYIVISIWSTTNSLLFPNVLVLANAPKQFFQVNVLEVLMRILALGGLLMIGNVLQGRALKAGAYMTIFPGIVTFLLDIAHLHKLLPVSEYLAFPQIVAMGVLASVTLTGTWTKPWVRVLCGALVVRMIFHWFIEGTDWVSGWLGGFITLAIIGFTANRKLFWTCLGVVALIVVLDFQHLEQSFMGNFYGSGPTHDIAREGHMGTFTNDRTRMWGAAVRYASSFPLGIGLGNYRSYENYFGRVDVWNTTVFTSAHGTYSQALSETGWPGFLALMLLIYSCCRMMRGYYFALPPGRAKTYVLGAWGGCIGVFAAAFNGDYLFPTYHNGGMGSFGACVYTWCIIGICVGIARQSGLDWSEILARPRPEKPRVVVAPIYNRPPRALPSSTSQSHGETAPG